MTTGNSTAENDALGELLGAVLREFAAGPVAIATGPAPADRATRAGIVRVTTATADDHDDFTNLLVRVFTEAHDALLGYAVNQLGTRDAAEDIVQSAFLRVFARKPAVDNAAALSGYLWTTTKNLTKDAQRRLITDRRRIDEHAGEHVALLAERAGLPVEDTVTLREMLITALDRLAPREREAVVLRGYGGYTYAHTARIMGIAEGTAKGYAHRGLGLLRGVLDGHR